MTQRILTAFPPSAPPLKKAKPKKPKNLSCLKCKERGWQNAAVGKSGLCPFHETERRVKTPARKPGNRREKGERR